MDDRSGKAREAMVEALAAVGAVSTPPVRAAMSRVRREAFVPRFWCLPPSLRWGAPVDVREWRTDDDGALGLLYDMDRALAIRRDPDALGATAGSGVTSAASAPRLVASMLELLDVAPGMSVLEIGAGSGYNAALLRELVGAEGRVVSVDIDAGLVTEAVDRLGAAGYDDVEVVAADGYAGLAERAPFDRVVATVGCADVAPAWLDQLAPGGFCLVPLEHGGWHPLTRVERVGGGEIVGSMVGRAGFVRIQGYQAGRSPWPRTGRLGPNPEVEWVALPADLAAELRPKPGRETIGNRRMWDLAYLLALEERRTSHMLSLAEEESSAAVDSSGDRIGWVGPAGEALRDRLLEVADRWVTLGRPSLGDYRSTFTPLPAARRVSLMTPPNGWSLDRLDFRQAVRLASPADPTRRQQ